MTAGPEGFDADFYLEMYPDVRDAGYDPYAHYLAHGKAEGRAPTWPIFEVRGDLAALDAGRENVLVVTHEASKTGSPILSIAIARELRRKYNVIAMLLNGGTIVDDFEPTADALVGPLELTRMERVMGFHVDRLLAMCPIKFAVVNSIVSRIALPHLARHFVPTGSGRSSRCRRR